MTFTEPPAWHQHAACAGTGTTLAVADLHGRDAIGIDIDARNPLLYEQRRAECARNLFDSPMPDTNQLDLFGGVA